MKITINEEIPDKTLAAILDGADIQYWALFVMQWHKLIDVVRGKKVLQIVDGCQDGQIFELNADSIETGLVIMSRDYPQYFADITSGEWDCETGDVLIQCALFGALLYG